MLKNSQKLLIILHCCSSFCGSFFITKKPAAVTDGLFQHQCAEPHHFYAAPAPGNNFDAAPASAPTLLYSQQNFKNELKFKHMKLSCSFDTVLFILLKY
jgi:hypothetical protein